MNGQQQQYHWTAKLPLMIVGLILAIVGILGWRKSALLGSIFIVLGGGIFLYAATIKNWCAPNESKFGTLTWGVHQFHSPSFVDCVKLTGLMR